MKFIWIAIIGFLVLSPVLTADFLVYDDGAHIYWNDALGPLNWETIKTIFSSTVNDTYIPLTILSFTLEYNFLELNPTIVHLNNLLLHLLNCYLIFQLVLNLGQNKRVAWFTALLFCIHPMHVESVAWATERKDVLYALFYLVSLNCYLKYLWNKKAKFYILSLSAAGLSVLAKPMALSLPFILLLIDYCFGNKSVNRKVLLEKIPFCLAVWPIAYITFIMNSFIMAPASHSLWKAPFIYSWCFWFYPLKFIFPFDFHQFYLMPDNIWISAISLGTMIYFLGCFLVLLTFRPDKHEKFYFFIPAYYFLSIFFLFRMTTLKFDLVADRFMYLPSLSLCLLFGVWADKYLCDEFRPFKIKKKAVVLLTIFLVTIAAKTHSQTKIWRNPGAFWEKVISRNKKISTVYSYRGDVYYDNGEYVKAVKDFTQALDLADPQYDSISSYFFYRGLSYAGLNKFEEAYYDLIRVENVEKFDYGHSWYGYILVNNKKYKEALIEITKAIKEEDIPSDRLNRGLCYMALDDMSNALKDFHKVLDKSNRIYDRDTARSKIKQIMDHLKS